MTLSSNFLQPGANKITKQGHPGQQVRGSGVEECEVGTKAQWPQQTKEYALNAEVSEVRIQPSDGEARLPAGEVSEWPGHLSNIRMYTSDTPSLCTSHYSGTCEGLPGVSDTSVHKTIGRHREGVDERGEAERQITD